MPAVPPTSRAPRTVLAAPGSSVAAPTFTRRGKVPIPTRAAGSRFSASFPKSNGSGWYASGGGAYGNNGRLTIRARCLDSDRVGSIKIQKEKEATVDANAGGYTFCPGNRAALTGGAYWLRPGKSVKKSAEAGVLSSASVGTFPSGFYATGQPQSGVPRQLVTIIHCVGN